MKEKKDLNVKGRGIKVLDELTQIEYDRITNSENPKELNKSLKRLKKLRVVYQSYAVVDLIQKEIEKYETDLASIKKYGHTL